jgi:hypothetical protein
VAKTATQSIRSDTFSAAPVAAAESRKTENRARANKVGAEKSEKGAGQSARSRIRDWLPWIVIALLGFGPLLLCALIGPVEAGGETGQKAAPDWSRAVRVGSGFYGTDSGAPFVVDEQGRVHLVWAVRFSAEEYDIRYTRLDSSGLVEEEHDLGVSLYQPRHIRVTPEKGALAQVFLLASFAQGAHSGLYHFVLSSDGEVIERPTLLSSRGSDCFEYDVAQDASGLIHVFWTEGAGTERDLHYVALFPDATGIAVPRLVARGVTSPLCAIGPGDTLHLFWEQPGSTEDTAELHHAVVEVPVPDSVSGPKLLDLPAGSRFFRIGPVVAFDSDYAYLVWTVEYRRDMGAPAISQGWYGSLALASASTVQARSFTLPVEEKPVYVEHQSPYGYEHLVPSQGEAEYGSERITYPSALKGDLEAMVTCGMSMLRGMSLEHQIVNLIFADGELLGYQVAGNTMHWSRISHLVADQNGVLHLSWVEGLEPGPSDVYYASTSLSVRERLDRVTGEDLQYAVLNTAFSAVAGLPAIPMAIAWIVPPVIWALLAGRFFVGGRGVVSYRGCIALALSVVIFGAAMLYFSPALLSYVPFSVSVPFLPIGLYAPIRLLVPATIFLLAAMGTAIAAVRAEVRSLLATTLIFCMIDSVLTLVIYGPGLAVAG